MGRLLAYGTLVHIAALCSFATTGTLELEAVADFYLSIGFVSETLVGWGWGEGFGN